MRILQVTANYRPSVGGIERYVEHLASGLAGRGHEVVVLTCRFGDAPHEEERAGVRIVRMRSTYVATRVGVHYPIPTPMELGRRLSALVRWSDVVHVHDALYVTTTAALLRAHRLARPSLLTQHIAFTPQANRALDAAENLLIATLGRASRRASRVVAYNEAVARWAERTWGLTAVSVLPPGVPEPDAGGTSREELRREFDLDPNRFVALFVGRDVPTKRLDLVLAAADPAWEILAVTDRSPSAARPGVRLMGFMHPDRLERLLLAVDAFVLPSETEGFPLSLQEALLAGLPSIVTRVPGFDRYLGESDVVWVEPTAHAISSALATLVSDPEARALLAARSSAVGRREFGLDRFLDRHVELYLDVLER